MRPCLLEGWRWRKPVAGAAEAVSTAAGARPAAGACAAAGGPCAPTPLGLCCGTVPAAATHAACDCCCSPPPHQRHPPDTATGLCTMSQIASPPPWFPRPSPTAVCNTLCRDAASVPTSCAHTAIMAVHAQAMWPMQQLPHCCAFMSNLVMSLQQPASIIYFPVFLQMAICRTSPIVCGTFGIPTLALFIHVPHPSQCPPSFLFCATHCKTLHASIGIYWANARLAATHMRGPCGKACRLHACFLCMLYTFFMQNNSIVYGSAVMPPTQEARALLNHAACCEMKHAILSNFPCVLWSKPLHGQAMLCLPSLALR